MKKNLLCTIVFLFIASLLCACSQKGDEAEYTQNVLQEPERIEVVTGSSTVVYEKDTEEYRKIFDTINPNWWKTAKDTPDTASDEVLIAAESPDHLKTTSDRTYADGSDTFVRFLYEETPVQWVQSNGEALEIQIIAFVMPPAAQQSHDNVKGFFLISQTDAIGYNEGLFTYYFPPEVAGGFWNFLVH